MSNLVRTLEDCFSGAMGHILLRFHFSLDQLSCQHDCHLRKLQKKFLTHCHVRDIV